MARPFPSHLLILALAGLLLLPAAAFFRLHLSAPFDNGRLQPGADNITARGVIVTPLPGGPEGFQAGDEVLAVNGRSLEAYAQGLFRGGVTRPAWQVGDIVTYTVWRDGQTMDVAVTLGRYPLTAVVRRNWGTILFALVFQSVAAVVFARRPHQRVVQILFLYAASILSATTWSLGLQVSDFVHGLGFWLYKVTTLGVYMLYWVAGFHFALLFPRPLPLTQRWRWLAPVMYILPYLLMLIFITAVRSQADGALDWIRRWTVGEGVHAAVFLALTLLTVIWQYRRSRDNVTRRQMRWVAWAALLSGGGGLLFYILPGVIGGLAVDPNVAGLIVLPFPLAIAVAILRHNLFDIDRLLNRTLVYGALTAVIISLYVLVVGSLSALFQTRGNFFISLLATGVAAVLFQPLRDWLQQRVNRFLYGEREEPFEVLARLGQRLESTLSPEMVYPTIVETVAQALKLPYTAVAVWRGGALETVESYGRPVADPVTYPLTYQGERVGQLQVARRAPDEPFSPADERILRNVVRQAGAAVHAVKLMADLRQSRQQLVTAREEERRRLRRDLHDGLGPQLASQTLTIEAIDRLLTRDAEKARALLHDLKAQSQAAVQDIRRLVYALRPPALDELGLAGALHEGAARQSRNGLYISVQAPAEPAVLPAAVEVAAYRIAQEALHNVVRHAQASRCTVSLRIEREMLWVEVTDNGCGVPPDGRSGVGLQSMRERAAELNGSCQVDALPGGGTRVLAGLPLKQDVNV